MSSTLSLFCYVLGDDSNNIFPVDIEPSKTVGHLKATIKEENSQAFKDVDAKTLRLWKVSIAVDSSFKERIETSIFVDEESLKPIEELSDIFPELPSRKQVHIVVKPPFDERGSPRKRKEADDAGSVIERWQSKRIKVELPTIAELARIADLPLADNEKIPIPVDYMEALVCSVDAQDICTSNDVEILFRAGDGYPSLNKFFSAVAEAPPTGGTEDSFHYFWDNNVRAVLQLLFPNGRSTRNSNLHTATRLLRPDYAFILNKLCPFRGEEKAPESTGDPKKELADKLAWAYEPAPYVLGYYAKGPDLTLVAISPPSQRQGRPVVHDVAYANLRLRRHRIKNIRRLINLAGLFQRLADLVRPSDAEFEQLERDHCTVEIAGHCIIKEYTGPDKAVRVENLRKTYHLLQHKGVPHVDSLVHHFDTTVVLSPRGNPKPPETEPELLAALVCVLEALEFLHTAPPLFHRDIRWPNVIRRLDDPQDWFLIDWEDAAKPPTKVPSHFAHRGHSPQVFTDGHGAEVDIWGVGELIVQCGALDISSELLDVGKWMQASAPSAQEALAKIKMYQLSHP